MFRRVGLLIVLLGLMVLTTGAIQAAPRLAGPRPASESGVLDRLLGWLSDLLHPEAAGNHTHTRSIWEGEGSHWDPNGNH
jgi:hypothetical protein